MRTFIVGLLAFGITSQSFAGTIVNRSSNESIIFTLNNDDTVTVKSHARGLRSKEIQLESLSKKDVKYRTALMPVSDAIIGGSNEELFVGYTILIPFTLAANAIDVLALTVRGPARLIKNSNNKKDYSSLANAIVTNESVDVSEARFERIVSILNN